MLLWLCDISSFIKAKGFFVSRRCRWPLFFVCFTTRLNLSGLVTNSCSRAFFTFMFSSCPERRYCCHALSSATRSSGLCCLTCEGAGAMARQNRMVSIFTRLCAARAHPLARRDIRQVVLPMYCLFCSAHWASNFCRWAYEVYLFACSFWMRSACPGHSL